MKLKNPMLVVTDIERSVEFYKTVLGLHVIMDFGANKTMTGGLVLQTIDTYKEFIGTSNIGLAAIILRSILRKTILISLLTS